MWLFVFVAHCNPLGLIIVCFDSKSFLLPREAQKVITIWLDVNLTCADSQLELDLKMSLEKGESSSFREEEGREGYVPLRPHLTGVFIKATVCAIGPCLKVVLFRSKALCF